MTPSHAYYHYTTARYLLLLTSLVGPPGIEPGPYEPESHVLPVYYGPTKDITANVYVYHTSECTL